MRVSGQLNFLFTFTPRKITPVIHHTGGFVWPRTGLDSLEKIPLAARGNRTAIPRIRGHYNAHKNTVCCTGQPCTVPSMLGRSACRASPLAGASFPQVRGQEEAAKSAEHLAVGTASVLRTEFGVTQWCFLKTL